MAKTQDMPLTDSRLLGNCGRLKCCLLYEFSTYQESPLEGRSPDGSALEAFLAFVREAPRSFVEIP